jgi:hypothetical protein
MGQARHDRQRAGRVVADRAEHAGANLMDHRPIVEARRQHRDLADEVEPGARRLQHESQVLEDLLGLLARVILADQRALGVLGDLAGTISQKSLPASLSRLQSC